MRRDAMKPETPAERRLDALYHRLGPRYLLLAPVYINLVAVAVGTINIAGAAPALGATREEVLKLFPLLAITHVPSITILSVLALWKFRAVIAWTYGARDRDTAERVCVEIFTNIRWLVVFGIVLFMILGVPACIAATRILDLPAYSALILLAATLVLTSTSGLLDYLGVNWLAKPILRDAASVLPGTFDPRLSEPTVPHRVFASMVCVSAIAGLIAHQAGTLDVLPIVRLAIGVATALAITLTFTVTVTYFLNRSMATPLRELLEATRRVESGDFSKRVPIISADEFGDLIRSFNRMTEGLRDREALRSAMGVYVDPAVADRILHEGQEFGASEEHVTVLVLDIRNFTAFADARSAAEVVRYLNDFFHVVGPIIEGHGGQTNKFLGDGLLAVFGMPPHRSGHADRALTSAREIASAVSSSHHLDVRIGIGLNSGTVVAGPIGGGTRLEYTLIGDVVNVATRVEQLTKQTDDTILLTEQTRTLLRDATTVGKRATVPVRGKPDPIAVYAPAETRRAVTPDLVDLGN